MKMVLSNDADKFINLESTLIELSQRERLAFALKKWGFWFGLAIGSVFIPVFHFVLVPSFLLVAFIFGFKAFKVTQRIILTKEYLCMVCNKQLVFPDLFSPENPFSCTSCGQRYTFINVE
ncbi:MAG: hypothetical protein RJB66_1942 [Pseudomonadota bacterium]|jgi:DNA-directed RNA polymerase subunit RPC12/RpoP